MTGIYGAGGSILMLVIVLGIIALFGAMASDIAIRKGNNAIGAFLLGFFLGPIGVLIAGVWPTNQDALDERAVDQGRKKYCPACENAIWKGATKCQ